MYIILWNVNELFFYDTYFHFNRLESLDLRPEESPYISFRADVPSLRESLYKFGRVDSRGLPIETAFADPQMSSTSLPNVFEDYGDAEHHILYKTVEEIKKINYKDSSVSCQNMFSSEKSNVGEFSLRRGMTSHALILWTFSVNVTVLTSK